MFRACTLKFKGNWDNQLPLTEFAYNKNFQAPIKMVSYEVLYGRKCRSPLFWDKIVWSKIVGLKII